MTEVAYPLKLKYRNPNRRLWRREGIDPPGGTLCFSGGTHSSKKGGNSGSGTAKVRSLLPRMRAYWGAVAR